MAGYTVSSEATTIVADATLVIIHTDSTLATGGSNIIIYRAWCGQTGSDTSDQLGIKIALKASAFPTVTSATPAPHFVGGRVSGIAGGTAGAEGTAGVDASAEGGGSVTNILVDAFNNLNGWLWVPTPEERIRVPADTAVILKLIGTPGTLTGWYFGMSYEETN